MCEFISWIEKNNQVLFLTDNDVFGTKKGKDLQEYCFSPDDYTGHGAIRYYYENFRDGEGKEATDFHNPHKFPKKIIKAILNGELVLLGNYKLLDIFTPKAQEAFCRKLKIYTVWSAYDKARSAYDKALSAYDKALSAYDKALSVCNKAWPACNKAWPAYNKARYAYKKARYARDKTKVKKEIFLLLKNKKNLRKAWRQYK